MIPNGHLVDLADKKRAWISEKSWKPRKIRCIENLFPSGVARFVARKNTPPVDMSCSYSLNGSDLEQIVHNRIGRLSLE